jgi:dihydroorotate dehydrogenase
VGTVTPRPQPGNPRPRLFRLPAQQALVNRMGFNGPGMVAVARNLRARSNVRTFERSNVQTLVIGVNIGKNRDTPLERAAEDYLAAFETLAPLADYVTVNISSPNTPGLRRLHERTALEELLGALAERNRALARPRPLFLKISPDETAAAVEEVVAAGREAGCDGFVATNTTLARDGLRGRAAREEGGLSGRPLATRARDTVARIHRLTGGEAPVIGVGGVASAADAYALIRAGASLVQLYTGLVYEGPALVRDIKRGLAALLWRDGLRSATDAVGVDVPGR